jgi:glycosyltransferase involved in cell wall biosynthesis
MATYNGAKYLQEQLDSFLCQTCKPTELIVCDDGSSDATIEIIEAFSEYAPFKVLIYRNETNLGYTKNFAKALSNCSGDLILLSDQDDVWLPEKVEVVANSFLAHSNKQLIIHDGELVDEDLVSLGQTKLGQIMAGYGTDVPFVTGALSAIRATFLPFILPIPDGIKGHDGWIHYIARLLDTRFVLNQNLQVIRRHSNNTSTWIASSTKKISMLDVLKSQLKTTRANGYEDRILINQMSKERLCITSRQCEIFSKEIIEKGLIQLMSERKALEARDNLIKASFLIRKILSLQLLLKNDYKFFNGFMSFLRDFTR